MSAEPRTPKEAIYDEQISPLMDQIIALCKENKINMAATFSLGVDLEDDETLFCTTLQPVDKEDEEGYKRIQECRAVMFPRSQITAFTITTHKGAREFIDERKKANAKPSQ